MGGLEGQVCACVSVCGGGGGWGYSNGGTHASAWLHGATQLWYPTLLHAVFVLDIWIYLLDVCELSVNKLRLYHDRQTKPPPNPSSPYPMQFVARNGPNSF